MEDACSMSGAPLDRVNHPAALAQLAERFAEYTRDPRAESTQRVYATAWRQFEEWCRTQSGAEAPLPSPPEVVAFYCAELADKGHALNTILVTLAAIGNAHKARNLRFERTAPALELVLDNIRNKLGETPPNRKAPIVLDALVRVVEPLGDKLVDHRDRAILVVGFFGAYRRAELVALNVPDVERSHDPKHGTYLRTLIRKSKRDRTGKGIVRGLWQQEDPRVCPVAAFDTWIAAAGIVEGAIFRGIDRFGRLGARALSPASVGNIVKERAAAVGLNPDDLAGHSLRRGLATTADREGRTLSEIADHLAHADIRTTRGYVTHPSVVRNNLTRGMARRTG